MRKFSFQIKSFIIFFKLNVCFRIKYTLVCIHVLVIFPNKMSYVFSEFDLSMNNNIGDNNNNDSVNILLIDIIHTIKF